MIMSDELIRKPQTHSNKTVKHELAPVVGATGLLALIGLALAAAAYVRRYVLHDLPMTAALMYSELHDYYSKVGRIAFYTTEPVKRAAGMPVAHPVRPLLLLHSINAAASSYEVKPLYEHYARQRKVYSLELPGFGFSERSNRVYSPQLYRDVINDFIQGELKGTSVDAVALSLSCEFLALAAEEMPRNFRSLTFISPTGMGANNNKIRPNDGLLRFLLMPSWSRLIFDLITSRPSIRLFSDRVHATTASHGFTHYAYVTSHQPNAEYAPYYFVSGKLFTPGILDTYLALQQPVLMVYGQRNFARYDRIDQFRDKTNWRIVRFTNCRDLVQFDDLAGLTSLMDKQFARV
jgi:pimeloyl-ACP methyl ester carboxylesterase